MRSASVLLMLVGVGAGCRHRVNDAALPVPTHWKYCWWTAVRSTLPADTVAASFRRAFVTVGLPNIHWTRSGDTIWVRGGPAPILRSAFDTTAYGATYWSRIVAFPRADSTHFRLYTAVTPDSNSVNFAACEAIARAAEVQWIKRAGDPGDEEKLPVWSRVP